jgi:hypothetical protein
VPPGSASTTEKSTAADRAACSAADDRLAALIRMIHRESDDTYGVPRITADLRDAGNVVDHKRVARVERGIVMPGCTCAASTAPPSRTAPCPRPWT